MRKTKNKRNKQTQQREIVLDVFSEKDIEHWASNSISATQCSNRIHFDLEHQRASKHTELIAALQAAESVSIPLNNWVRVVDYQWSLQPLSMVGSISGIGGRFNYGIELTTVRRLEFPCLYLASDKTTAYCERFGGQAEEPVNGLTRQEYALRKAHVSFATFHVTGQVNQVFDLRDKRQLEPFAEIIATFSLSKSTKDTLKRMRYPITTLIRTADELRRRLLAPPEQWRQSGNVFGTPAPSQIFGWFLREAGFEGVVYPSQQGGDSCLGIFPENFKSSDSVVEVSGPHPSGATHTRLDRNNLLLPAR